MSTEQKHNVQRFTGQVAIVTGGGSGIGFGIVERLASEDANVVIFDINDTVLQQAKQSLEKSGVESNRILPITVNVTNEEQVKNAFELVISTYNRVDVLIQSAGITGKTGITSEKVEYTDFMNVINVNLVGCFLCCKYALPHMIAAKYGRIVNIASIAGKEGNAGMVAYSASKAGVIGLTKSMGKEYAELGITVNAIAPAVVRTAMVAAMPEVQVKYMTDKIPMKRTGEISEIASLATFIASKESSFTTGFCWDATGGRAVY